MTDRLIVVLDVGKTMAKLTLWTPRGEQLDRVVRRNERIATDHYVALDAEAIREWLMSSLAAFARAGPIGHIIPVGHGAAAAVVKDGALLCPPLDYEEPISPVDCERYDADRDPFALTGSPRLPDGLNLGAQLERLAKIHPGMFEDPGVMILPWPQYWAWVLSGVASSELTSLGCHTDLWRPGLGCPSALSEKRGWAARIPPLRHAGEALGPILPELAARTGISPDAQIHAGLHDSNAALLAARGFPEIRDREATVLSTGTWFVAMRTPGPDAAFDMASLSAARDCLVNVDVEGRPIPSARFMGGREIEILTGVDSRRIDIKPDQPAILDAASRVLGQNAMVLPTFAPGFGPFPDGRGRWLNMPDSHIEQRAAVSLYAALVADTSLDLIGARDAILVEGRFAEADLFVRALATFRPGTRIYTSNAHNDVSFGALRLIDRSLAPSSTLCPVEPLDLDLDGYFRRWRSEVERMEMAI